METIGSYRFNHIPIIKLLKAVLQSGISATALCSTKTTEQPPRQRPTRYAPNQNADRLLWLLVIGTGTAGLRLHKVEKLHGKNAKPRAKQRQTLRLIFSISHALGHFRSIVLTALLTAMFAACVSTGVEPQGSLIATPIELPSIRPPALGQQWVYQLRDVYSQTIVDEITETIISTTPTIRIQRISKNEGALPDEVHSQWGMLIQDSHWELPITFSKPIPAWPPGVELNHSMKYQTQYQLLTHPDYYYFWNLTITARDWQSISVPAGEFKVLHYTNHILFQSPEFYYRIHSERDESIWFSPEIGRWVLRRSYGSYNVSGRGGDGVDDFFQWELKSWR